MAERAPGPCRLFQKGSCRFGARCKYSHVASGSVPSATASRRGNDRTGGQGSASPQTGPSSNVQVPPGVCRVYWTAGKCNRAFECTFKHLKGSSAPAGLEASPNNKGNSVSDDTPDFFSAEGLAVNAGAGNVERHSLTPVEAHNHMRPFMRDNYHFESAARVQGFVRIFASVNDRNKAWVSVSQRVV